MTFLTLPTELRFQIYGYLCDIRTTPFSAYRGLYLSCHAIKAELDNEGGRLVRADLSRVLSTLESSYFTIPAHLHAMQHIYLVKKVGLTQSHHLWTDVVNLFPLYLASLTIAAPCGDSVKAMVESSTHLLFLMLCHRLSRQNERVANITCVVLEMQFVNESMAASCLHTIQAFRDASDEYAYTFRWVARPGECVKAVWEVAEQVVEGRYEPEPSPTAVLRAFQGLSGPS